MLKYKVKTNIGKTDTKYYYIANAIDDDTHFIFETKQPHHLNNGDVVNMGGVLSVPVITRKFIKLGVGYDTTKSQYFFRWRYLDDSNGWSARVYVDNISTDKTYEIEITGGMVLQIKVDESKTCTFKPKTCDSWQDFVKLDTLDISQFYTQNSIIKTQQVYDNYFSVDAFDTKVPITILDKYWDDVKGLYVFRVNYFPILKSKVDELYVSFQDGAFNGTTSSNEEVLVESGGIKENVKYVVRNITIDDEINYITYNTIKYYDGDAFFGVNGVTTFTESISSGIDVFQSSYVTDPIPADDLFSPTLPVSSEDSGLYNTLTGGKYVDPFYTPSYKVKDFTVNQLCGVDYYELFINTILNDGNTETSDFIPDLITGITKNINIKTIDIWKDQTYFYFESPQSITFDTRTQQTELVNTKFYEIEKEKSINPIIDMERVRVEPALPVLNTDGSVSYQSIKTVQYNFHFLNSAGTAWDVEPSFWSSPRLASSVLGSFDNLDVKYQKKRLKNTFVRLSYFDGKKPTNQTLYYYNTLYTNARQMYGKYLRGKSVGMCRINSDVIAGIVGPQYYFKTEFGVVNPMMLTSDNTSPTSEGYFTYILKEDAPGLVPLEMFIKVEFNNALNGERVLFFNRKPPSSKGVAMNNVYLSQSDSEDYIYLKVYVVYDDVMGRYVYYPATYYGKQYYINGKPGQNKGESSGGTLAQIAYEASTSTLTIDVYEAKVE